MLLDADNLDLGRLRLVVAVLSAAADGSGIRPADSRAPRPDSVHRGERPAVTARLQVGGGAARGPAPTGLAPAGLRISVAGHPHRLARFQWPRTARILPAAGWQQADALLAAAYVPDSSPLVLVSGDGDFALLAERHGGPVLVVGPAASTSGRLRRAGVAVVDPVHDGLERLRSWLNLG